METRGKEGSWKWSKNNRRLGEDNRENSSLYDSSHFTDVVEWWPPYYKVELAEKLDLLPPICTSLKRLEKLFPATCEHCLYQPSLDLRDDRIPVMGDYWCLEPDPTTHPCVSNHSVHRLLGTAQYILKGLSSSDVPIHSSPSFSVQLALHLTCRFVLQREKWSNNALLLFCSFCQASSVPPFCQMFFLGLSPKDFCFVFCTII